jgi:hypothetical protein
MGYATSWLAVTDPASELLLQNLGLTPIGEMASYGESLFTGRTLPSGWFILFINQCQHKFVKPKAVASLSTLGDVVACSIAMVETVVILHPDRMRARLENPRH